jgi:hypothetical protein
VMRPLRTVSIAVAYSLNCAAAAPPGELEAREAHLFAAVILYSAKAIKCTVKSPCCYSVREEVPSEELVTLLASKRNLKPIPIQGACGEWTIDVARVSRNSSDEQEVASAVGGQGLPLLYCTHVLHLTPDGWVVDPKRDRCPVT